MNGSANVQVGREMHAGVGAAQVTWCVTRGDTALAGRGKNVPVLVAVVCRKPKLAGWRPPPETRSPASPCPAAEAITISRCR